MKEQKGCLTELSPFLPLYMHLQFSLFATEIGISMDSMNLIYTDLCMPIIFCVVIYAAFDSWEILRLSFKKLQSKSVNSAHFMT